MPSKESEYLKTAYEAISDEMAANPQMSLSTMRSIYESLHTATLEPEGVCYKDVDAGGVSALWCTPKGASADRVILHTHGGGYMIGSKHMHRKLVGHIAKAVGARGLALDYRLAPESPFPAALEDVESSYRWLLGQGIPSHQIAITGDSGGGGLCTGSVLKIQNSGLPLPGAVVAISPWYDMELLGESMESKAHLDAGVTRATLQIMRDGLLAGVTPPTEPLVNPLHADLAGFPPVFLQTGDHETLFDDTTRFAARAREYDVDVTVSVFPGMQHDFQLMAGRAVEADEAITEIGKWLRVRLGL